MEALLRTLQEQQQQGQPHALATVIEVTGSSSAIVGSKAVIGEAGDVLIGWVGGGCAQSTVCQAARDALQDGSPRVVEIDMENEASGMPCGGKMRVFVEPLLPSPRLYLLGHGQIAETVCSLAAQVGFKVTVHDVSATAERFPTACHIDSDDLGYSHLDLQAGDYVVIATQHKGDYRALRHVLNKPMAYVALIASHKRGRLIIEKLSDEGVDPTALARLRTPAGLNLGAQTPEEIALSVVSEMVMIRRGASGQSKSQVHPLF